MHQAGADTNADESKQLWGPWPLAAAPLLLSLIPSVQMLYLERQNTATSDPAPLALCILMCYNAAKEKPLGAETPRGRPADAGGVARHSVPPKPPAVKSKAAFLRWGGGQWNLS
jgi:hypothetical protein